MDIRIKRAYDPALPSDGYRILVDRIWPRGISKEHLRIDAWLKDIAPSTALRKWYDHDPVRWEAFKDQYFLEIGNHSEFVQQIVDLGNEGTITLVFAARDVEHSHAKALLEYLSSYDDRSSPQ